MSSNRRFALAVAALLVLGVVALVALYVPLRRAGRTGSEGPVASSGLDAAELDRYLAARQAIHATYEEFGGSLTRFLDPSRSRQEVKQFQAMLAVTAMAHSLQSAIEANGLTLRRYAELTDLVYMRWWRAASGNPPPEAELVGRLHRFLEKLDAMLAKIRSEEGRTGIEAQAADVQARLPHLERIAAADPDEVLGAIPEETRALLEERREVIAAADMGLFDTDFMLGQWDESGALPEPSGEGEAGTGP